MTSDTLNLDDISKDRLSYCISQLFLNKDDLLGPILFLIYYFQPTLFWMVILNSDYDITALFVDYLLRLDKYALYTFMSLMNGLVTMYCLFIFKSSF